MSNTPRHAVRLLRVLVGLLLFAGFVHVTQAQLLSVDVNGTVRSDVTAPGFTPWYLAPDITSHKNSGMMRHPQRFQEIQAGKTPA